MGRVASGMGNEMHWAGAPWLMVISIPLLVALIVWLRPTLVAVAVVGHIKQTLFTEGWAICVRGEEMERGDGTRVCGLAAVLRGEQARDLHRS